MKNLFRIWKSQREFDEYINRPDDTDKPCVAYFCMEFGIHHCLKIYSGGLGILAGDYLKEASDSNLNIIGVGFYTGMDISDRNWGLEVSS